MKKGYVYKIINTENTKLYIGQTTVSLDKRWKDHLSASKQKDTKGVILYDAMKKYGVEKFSIVLLEEIEANNILELKQKLNERECYYIYSLNTLRPNGYNSTKGGYNNSVTIHKVVIQYSLDGMIINRYSSINDASAAVNPRHNKTGNIFSVCNGDTKTAFGYVWRYENDPFDLFDSKHSNDKPVLQYTKSGELVKKYSTMRAAAKALGVFDKEGNPRCSQICSCCGGHKLTAYGYVWRYDGDSFEKYRNKRIDTRKKINVYDSSLTFIETMDCMDDITQKYKISFPSIYKSFKKNHKCKGYYFYYANDPNQPDKLKVLL